MSYTKGPWKAGAVKQSEITFTGPYINITAKGAILEVQPSIAAGRGIEECKSNARLIAAAPDMLEALKKALSVIEHLDYLGGKSVERAEIVQAIAKAEGK